MRTRTALGVVLVMLVAGGCREDKSPWFGGDLSAALTAAQARGTLVFLDFYSPT